MVDARGHGRSDGPEHGYSQEILNQDVAELIRVLKLAQPVLMEYSSGALAAAQYPELMRATVREGRRACSRYAAFCEGKPYRKYTSFARRTFDFDTAPVCLHDALCDG